MGIVGFCNKFFKSGLIQKNITNPNTNTISYIDGNLMWYKLSGYNIPDPTTFHIEFVKYLKTVIERSENSEKFILKVVFDNPFARPRPKFAAVIDRACVALSTNNIMHPVDINLIKILLTNLELKNFEVFFCEMAADDYIRDEINKLLIENSFEEPRLLVINDGNKKITTESSNIVIYSNDSDFVAFFPDHTKVGVYAYNSLTVKLLNHGPIIDDLSDIRSNKWFFIKINAMFSHNDFISVSLFDLHIFKITENFFYADPNNEVESNLGQVHFILLYYSNWLSCMANNVDKIKLRALINNSIKSCCIAFNKSFDHVEINDQNSNQKIKYLLSFRTNPDKNITQAKLAFDPQEFELEQPNDQLALLNLMKSFISNMSHKSNADFVEKNFKYLLKNDKLKQINVSQIVFKYLDNVLYKKLVNENGTKGVGRGHYQIPDSNDAEFSFNQSVLLANLLLNSITMWIPLRINSQDKLLKYFIYRIFSIFNYSRDVEMLNNFFNKIILLTKFG